LRPAERYTGFQIIFNFSTKKLRRYRCFVFKNEGTMISVRRQNFPENATIVKKSRVL
jgi:hypothetical protein